MPRRYEPTQLAAAIIVGTMAAPVILIFYHGVCLWMPSMPNSRRFPAPYRSKNARKSCDCIHESRRRDYCGIGAPGRRV